MYARNTRSQSQNKKKRYLYRYFILQRQFSVYKDSDLLATIQGDFEINAIIVTTTSRTVVIWKYRKTNQKVEWGKTQMHHPRREATDPPFKQYVEKRSNKDDTFSFT